MNANREYFQKRYSRRWLAGRQLRSENLIHQQYQDLTLDLLGCNDALTLLESGCGSGELLLRLRARHPGLTLAGCDLGFESLRSARQHGLDSHAGLVQSDITQLPWPSDHFDRVLCSSVLWYVPEPALAIAEFLRVLKPGGRFVFDVRNPFHISNITTRLSLALRRRLHREAPYYSFLSPRAIRRLLARWPVTYEMRGCFVALPVRIPLVRSSWGNLCSRSDWLSFRAGHRQGKWFAQKLLVHGTKLAPSGSVGE